MPHEIPTPAAPAAAAHVRRPVASLPATPRAGTGHDDRAKRLRRERALFVRYRRERDPRARQLLVERFLPLARHLARQHAGPDQAFDDVFQVACIALVKAVDRFDPDRGVAFSSYAIPTITGEIKRYFRDTAWAVHVPRGDQDLALAIQHATRRLTQQLGRRPSVEEIAERLGRTDEDVVTATRAMGAYRAASLDAPSAAYDDVALADTLGTADDRLALVEDRLHLSALMRCLSKREREALWLHFTLELTQSEISERLGVPPDEVSRTLRQAMSRLPALGSREPQPARRSRACRFDTRVLAAAG